MAARRVLDASEIVEKDNERDGNSSEPVEFEYSTVEARNRINGIRSGSPDNMIDCRLDNRMKHCPSDEREGGRPEPENPDQGSGMSKKFQWIETTHAG